MLLKWSITKQTGNGVILRLQLTETFISQLPDRGATHTLWNQFKIFIRFSNVPPKLHTSSLSGDKAVFTDFNSGALNMPTAYLVTNLTLTKSDGPTTHSLVYTGKGFLWGVDSTKTN